MSRWKSYLSSSFFPFSSTLLSGYHHLEHRRQSCLFENNSTVTVYGYKSKSSWIMRMCVTCTSEIVRFILMTIKWCFKTVQNSRRWHILQHKMSCECGADAINFILFTKFSMTYFMHVKMRKIYVRVLVDSRGGEWSLATSSYCMKNWI